MAAPAKKGRVIGRSAKAVSGASSGLINSPWMRIMAVVPAVIPVATNPRATYSERVLTVLRKSLSIADSLVGVVKKQGENSGFWLFCQYVLTLYI